MFKCWLGLDQRTKNIFWFKFPGPVLIKAVYSEQQIWHHLIKKINRLEGSFVLDSRMLIMILCLTNKKGKSTAKGEFNSITFVQIPLTIKVYKHESHCQSKIR